MVCSETILQIRMIVLKQLILQLIVNKN